MSVYVEYCGCDFDGQIGSRPMDMDSRMDRFELSTLSLAFKIKINWLELT